MKIAVIIVRILMGLMFLMPPALYFSNHMPQQPPMSDAAKQYMTGMAATGYFMPLLMGTQLVCGLAFVIGRFVPLATVVIFPVVLNIVLYHAFLDTERLPMAIALLAANLFLAFAHRKNYAGLLAAK